jgi:ATP-dependent DNA ligase
MPKLFRFPSKSSPGKVYITTLHDDGTCTCDETPGNECRGYKYSKKIPRECTHTKEVLLKEASGKPISKTLLNTNMCPVKPMLASSLPEEKTISDYPADEWVLEEKYNGHRRIIDTESLRAWSRVGNEVLLPRQIANELGFWGAGLIDCELVVPGGTATDVKALENESRLELYVFDALEIVTPLGARQSLCNDPMTYRRTFLERLATITTTNFVHLAPQFGPSEEGLQEIWDRGGEGAVLKRKSSLYQSMKRSRDWVKFKREIPHAMMIVGFGGGEYGPYSVLLLEDEEGATTSVKTKDGSWREAIAAAPGRFLHQILMIEHRGRTEAGSFVSPMADHFLREDLIP